MAISSSPARRSRNKRRLLVYKLRCSIALLLNSYTSEPFHPNTGIAKNEASNDSTAFERGDAGVVDTSPNVSMVSLPKCVALFGSIRSALEIVHTKLGRYLVGFSNGSYESLHGRHRDALPLPSFKATDLEWRTPVCHVTKAGLTEFLTLVAGALNWMYGKRVLRAMPKVCTRLHKKVLQGLLDKLLHLWTILEPCIDQTSSLGAYEKLVGVATQEKYPDLMADKVDIPRACGLVDPMVSLPLDVQSVLRDPEKLFVVKPNALPSKAEFTAGRREEYVALVSRQIRARKVALTKYPMGCGSIFSVGKKSGERQREVWNGSVLSSLCHRPPKPPFLACPSALTELEATDERLIYASTRDGLSFFDQLRLPSELRAVMCRPYVTGMELLQCRHGGIDAMTVAEIQQALLDDEEFKIDCVYYPASLVWPMGFAWSSYIAQSQMLHTILMAGFDYSNLLSEEGHLVDVGKGAISLATDDVVHFAQLSEEEFLELDEPPLKQLDEVWKSIGLQEKVEKHQDLQTTTTILGVQLLEGRYLTPKPKRFIEMFLAVVDLLLNPLSTPLELHSLLGMLQWHDLLCRPLYSVLHCIYAFVQLPDERRQQVWASVLDEILLNVILCPTWVIDLAKPWHNEVYASDASGSYGFGVCSTKLPLEVVRSIASACKNHIFRLTRADCDPQIRRREGKEFVLPVRMRDFKTLMSIKARRSAHSGSLEASAAVLGIRRLLRNARAHGHRAAYLVDAQAVQGALKKGRSSAPTLKRLIAQAGALQIAGDVKLYFGYITSEDNPADAPSRGRKQKYRARRPLSTYEPFAKYHRIVRQTRRALRSWRWPQAAGGSSVSVNTSYFARSDGTDFNSLLAEL